MNSKKILIVEDDQQLQSALKDKFDNEGFDVFVASDGEEGLAITGKEKPDLILIDILLPKVDGIVMAKEIKKLNLGTMMIFLTNLSDMQHIADALEASYGDVDYLVKSDWDIDDIVKKVKERLNIK
ncbi:MAG: response regulator [Candidatus Staskawiczbacteria bacterium]|nr:response regulator [Candidatus Staskawiczbacteria bacterium]